MCSSARLGRSLALALALAGSLGCELSVELGAYAPMDGDTTGSTVVETDSESAEASEEGGSGGGETESSGDDESDSGTGDGDPGDGDGDEGRLCRIDGSEDPCQTCLEFVCCEQLENCDVESGCNCMVECLVDTDPVTCAMTCAPGPAYFQLLQCQMTSCAAACV